MLRNVGLLSLYIELVVLEQFTKYLLLTVDCHQPLRYFYYTQLYQIVSGGNELFSKTKRNKTKNKQKQLEMIASDVFIDSLPTFNKKILVLKYGSF